MSSDELLSICCSSLEETEQYKTLKCLIDNENAILKHDITRHDHFKDEFKNGIYFAYECNEIVYVGKVGNSSNTSLYHRFVGNGNSAHNSHFDYDEVKFHRFHDLSDKRLLALEAMFIMVINPKHNKAV